MVRAAESGHEGALYQLGLMYYRGEGVKKDRRKALEYCQEAGSKGLAEAQLHCGRMYLKGEGTKKDSKKALRWFEKAGNNSCREAWLICGRMYYKGTGTDADHAKALLWCEKAVAEADCPGNAEAKYICAMILSAQGKPKEDREKGLLLMKEAADQGYKPAWIALKFKFRSEADKSKE